MRTKIAAVNTGTLAMLLRDQAALARAGFASWIQAATPRELYLYINERDEERYRRIRPLG